MLPTMNKMEGVFVSRSIHLLKWIEKCFGHTDSARNAAVKSGGRGERERGRQMEKENENRQP